MSRWRNSLRFHYLWTDILATLIGGVILAFLFFWFREKVFPLPRITGRWYFEMHTVSTSYKPYENMVLRYVAILWREGSRVEGTVEKLYENSSTGEREYIGPHRTRGKVDGYVEKKYFGKDRLYLHVIEDGHGRESTHFYEVVADSDTVMDGTFSSMVANQSGRVRWQRSQF